MILTVLLPTAALLCHPSTDVEVAYAPAAGSHLSRTWTLNSREEVAEATLQLMGDEHDAGGGMVRASERSLEVVDHIVGVEEGRPTRLVRTLVDLARDTEVEADLAAGTQLAEPRDVDSPLLDRAVAFEWNDEDGEYDAAFDDERGGEDEWLAGLSEDMDLRALLPDRPVDVGASWSVDVAALGSILRPGGDFEPPTAVGEPDDLPEGGIAIVVPDAGGLGRWGELDGAIEAKLVGLDEEDGRRLARISLEVQAEGVLDVAEDLLDEAEQQGQPRVEYSLADLARTVEGEGELVWDLDAGRMVHLVVSLDTTTELELEWTIDAGGGLDVALFRASSGSLEIEATVADVESSEGL